jgi:hypothetical protein
MAHNEKEFFFSHKAIVEDLIKRQGIHEGRWMLTVELGLKGTNVLTPLGEGKSTLVPAGVLTISRIGITRTKEVNDLSVDAAEVNPSSTTRRRSTKRLSKKGR